VKQNEAVCNLFSSRKSLHYTVRGAAVAASQYFKAIIIYASSVYDQPTKKDV